MSAQNAAINITHYTIISKIGEGSFSKVYRVKDIKTKISYAAKVSKFMIEEETKDSSEALSLFGEVNLMYLLKATSKTIHSQRPSPKFHHYGITRPCSR